MVQYIYTYIHTYYVYMHIYIYIRIMYICIYIYTYGEFAKKTAVHIAIDVFIQGGGPVNELGHRLVVCFHSG
jgi:hypothetical protein